MVEVTERNNARLSGTPDGPVIAFAHGFGCDQSMWRFVAPEFERDHHVLLFDHVGFGGSDVTAFDHQAHAHLERYAQDTLEILDALALDDVVFVGHSVSAMIGVLAARQAPQRFKALVLVGPSPRYVDDPPYRGGFSRQDIDDLLESIEANYLGWSAQMAPVIMGNPDRPALGHELTESFCRVDPSVALTFARATFLADNRADLPHVAPPCLVIQCAQDAIAPVHVGEYVRDALPNAALELLPVSGHCPNLSAPELTSAAIRRFLSSVDGA